jgi:hypothetical protein
MTRLDVFQAYDYYDTLGAQRGLHSGELNFFNYCIDNHNDICNEDTTDYDPVILTASELYDKIEYFDKHTWEYKHKRII